MELGNLAKINIRDVWKDEAKDFTPWLACEENILILSEEIGMQLEVVSVEKDVGPYRADIFCREISNGTCVVIENQLEKTDHNHLGQILTYAAGLKALTMVWIAKEFTEEHRAVIDWLNEITDETYNFFGIEVQAWQIGDSLPAPKFSIICKPNNWTKYMMTISETNLTKMQQFQIDYWGAFKKYLEGGGSTVLRIGKPQAQQWMSFSIGRSNFHKNAVVSSSQLGGELRVELVIMTNDSSLNSNYLSQLKDKTSDIWSNMGEELIWSDPEDTKGCKVYVRRSVELEDREDWENQFSWLRDKLELFDKVFKSVIKDLKF